MWSRPRALRVCLYILEELLPRFGVEVSFVDGTDLDQWRAAVRPGTKAVFFESMSNPTLEVVDIAAVARTAHAAGALVVVDNVFATPVFSAGGRSGRGCGGLFHDQAYRRAGPLPWRRGAAARGSSSGTLEPYLKHTGGAMSPFNAWVMLKGLETLDLRCRASAETAQKLAEALRGHPKLAQVIYPGLPESSAACADEGADGDRRHGDRARRAGGKAGAFRFLNALKIVLISNNLGDARASSPIPPRRPTSA
jgi:O-succinylhomoserine sulfhydrylase